MGRQELMVLGAITLSAGLLGGCGTSASSATTVPRTERSTCTQVGADLADGPDPRADPTGYALAQIAPLRQAAASTSDGSLREAIVRLDGAYQAQYRAGAAGPGPAAAVDSALADLQTYCPGVGS